MDLRDTVHNEGGNERITNDEQIVLLRVLTVVTSAINLREEG